MSDVEISQKQQIDSNDQKPDGKSVTESLRGFSVFFAEGTINIYIFIVFAACDCNIFLSAKIFCCNLGIDVA